MFLLVQDRGIALVCNQNITSAISDYYTVSGQRFAMMEIKSTVSKVVRHFKLKPAHPEHQIQIVSETILKSKNGVKISLQDR